MTSHNNNDNKQQSETNKSESSIIYQEEKYSDEHNRINPKKKKKNKLKKFFLLLLVLLVLLSLGGYYAHNHNLLDKYNLNFNKLPFLYKKSTAIANTNDTTTKLADKSKKLITSTVDSVEKSNQPILDKNINQQKSMDSSKTISEEQNILKDQPKISLLQDEIAELKKALTQEHQEMLLVKDKLNQQINNLPKDITPTIYNTKILNNLYGMIGDIEYSINFQGNIKKSLAILNNMQTKVNLLTNIDKNMLTNSINQDIEQIKKISIEDNNKIYDKIELLNNLVVSLPLTSNKTENDSILAEKQISDSVKDWKSNILKNIDLLNNRLIKVSKINSSVKQQDENLQILLQQKISLLLTRVKLALLEKNTDLANNLVQQIEQYSNQYLDGTNSMANQFKQQLNQLVELIKNNSTNTDQVIELNSKAVIKQLLIDTNDTNKE